MHTFNFDIYMEDVDLGGIVFYANYWKYVERARSNMLMDIGITQTTFKEEGFIFVVRHVEGDYLSPARFEDKLEVRTEVAKVSGSSLTFDQKIYRAETVLFSAQVVVVCVTLAGRVSRIPAEIRAKLGADPE